MKEFTASVDTSDFFVVIHGDCPTGADKIAEETCRKYNIHSARVAARWNIGRHAGPIRNRIMAAFLPQKAYAFLMPNEPNRGTLDCIAALQEYGIEVKRINPSSGSEE